MICTGMCRVAGSCLSRSSTVQPCMSGRKRSSVIASGWYSRASASASAPRVATSPLKPAARARSSRMRAKCGSSSTISSTRSPGLDARRGRRGARRSGSWPRIARTPAGERRRAPAAASAPGAVAGTAVAQRQVQRERAALPGGAAAAGSRRRAGAAISRLIERPRPGAAVLAAGAAVGLLEGLEDDLLLVRRDADAGVGDRERDHGRRAAEDRVLAGPAAGGRADAQPHAALLGELERVGQQVLEHLLQPLARRSTMRGGSVRVELDVEVEPFALGHVAERAARRTRAGRRSGPRSTSTVIVPDSIFDRSRMSLIRFSRSVPAPWIVCANSTCFGGQVAARRCRRAAGRGSGGC